MTGVRTWTLRGGLVGEPTDRVRADGPFLSAADRVEVLEAAPVLDLLEAVTMVTMEGLASGVALTVEERQLVRLFQAHNRLPRDQP